VTASLESAAIPSAIPLRPWRQAPDDYCVTIRTRGNSGVSGDNDGVAVPAARGAAPYATPLREPAPLLGREKSGVGGTGIMTGETGWKWTR
jgi:hypothetical protein